MKFTDLFNLSGEKHLHENSCGGTLRLFGIDINITLYGNLEDWAFPLLIIPSLAAKGIVVQSLFLAIYLGRLPDEGK